MIDYAMSLEQIAEELGISWQRVQQLERSALRKIKPKLEYQMHGTWERKYDRLYRALKPQQQFGRSSCSPPNPTSTPRVPKVVSSGNQIRRPE